MNAREFFLSWGMLFIGVVLNVVGVYLVKMKINLLGEFQFNSIASVVSYFFTLVKFPLVIVGAISILAAPLPYAIALSRMELSVAYPVSVALNCLIILPLTVVLLGESISWHKAFGIGLILVSLYLLYR